MQNNIEAAFEKAAAGKPETAPEGKPVEAPTKTEEAVLPVENGQAESKPAPTEIPNEEWDGDVNKLPPELQSWAKKAQAGLTKKAMAESELRKKGQEYQELLNSEEWKTFQQSKNKPATPAQESIAPEATAMGITPDEWEAAQLDSTGQIANKLIQREIEKRVNSAAEQYGVVINQLVQKNETSETKSALSALADQHPDAVEMFQDGILEPLMKLERYFGNHKSHESVVQAAYDAASKIQAAADARALQKAQGRITEKKGAVSFTGISKGDLTHIEVPKEDVFKKAFEAALEGKKINVKSKK